jgi:SAM-dependent methyltransferase
MANARPGVVSRLMNGGPKVGIGATGAMAPEPRDRVSDFSYRMMVWTVRVTDLFFPKSNRLASFGIREGFVVLDYGCGPGRYLAEASKLVGPTGKVYAVDIHELAIQDVAWLKTKLNLPNVIPLLAEGYACVVPDHAADLIYALDMFLGVKDLAALLTEWNRMAKSQGILILEDGHQPRKRTKEKLALSPLWRIDHEERTYVRCQAV